MKTAIIALALLVTAALCAVLYIRHRMAHTPDSRHLAAAIDAEVAKHMKSGLFPGVVVGVFKDGRTYIKGYGSIDKAASRPPDAHTVFQIASVSKLLTASLLQALHDEGVVHMDATLGELLGPSIPLAPTVLTVTLRQLVTHTSGFPSIPKSLGDTAMQMAGSDDPMLNPYSYLGPQYVFGYLAHASDKREAGRFEYSNFGMGLLAYVLERVTGTDYETLVREKVLLPAGMHSTAITFTPDMRARLAQGHTPTGQPAPPWTFAALAGAGAYSSTAHDMLTFIQASLGGHKPTAQRFDAMHLPQGSGQFGIGWAQPSFLHRFFGNRGVVWHNGMVGGYASYVSIDPVGRCGVVLLTNQASATDMLGMMLMRQVRTQSWG